MALDPSIATDETSPPQDTMISPSSSPKEPPPTSASIPFSTTCQTLRQPQMLLPPELMINIFQIYISQFWDRKEQLEKCYSTALTPSEGKNWVKAMMDRQAQFLIPMNIVPLLTACRWTKETIIPFLYKKIKFLTSTQYLAFLETPHPSSYKHIEKIEVLESASWPTGPLKFKSQKAAVFPRDDQNVILKLDKRLKLFQKEEEKKKANGKGFESKEKISVRPKGIDVRLKSTVPSSMVSLGMVLPIATLHSRSQIYLSMINRSWAETNNFVTQSSYTIAKINIIRPFTSSIDNVLPQFLRDNSLFSPFGPAPPPGQQSPPQTVQICPKIGKINIVFKKGEIKDTHLSDDSSATAVENQAVVPNPITTDSGRYKQTFYFFVNDCQRLGEKGTMIHVMKDGDPHFFCSDKKTPSHKNLVVVRCEGECQVTSGVKRPAWHEYLLRLIYAEKGTGPGSIADILSQEMQNQVQNLLGDVMNGAGGVLGAFGLGFAAAAAHAGGGIGGGGGGDAGGGVAGAGANGEGANGGGGDGGGDAALGDVNVDDANVNNAATGGNLGPGGAGGAGEGGGALAQAGALTGLFGGMFAMTDIIMGTGPVVVTHTALAVPLGGTTSAAPAPGGQAATEPQQAVANSATTQPLAAQGQVLADTTSMGGQASASETNPMDVVNE